MKKSTFNKLVSHLNNILSQNKTITQYSLDSGLSRDYIAKIKSNLSSDYMAGKNSEEEMQTVEELYSQIKKRDISKIGGKPAKVEAKDEDFSRCVVDMLRDDENKISSYSFTIYIRDKAPLIGIFTREEMNMIYRLYSSYGTSITQREVSRCFPEYSLFDFKRILRAFNITKASAPFAPHVIEETEIDKLSEMQLREKENDFLRSIEQSKIRDTEALVKKYALENYELKNKLTKRDEIFKSLDFEPKEYITEIPQYSGENGIIIWLSDLHVGASVSDFSIYDNKYDVTERLEKIFDYINSLGHFDNIIVCNTGDSLDGMDKMTVRRDHLLEQNMNNKEQVLTYIKAMTDFMVSLKTITEQVSYYCVGESNHKF